MPNTFSGANLVVNAAEATEFVNLEPSESLSSAGFDKVTDL